MQKTFKILKDYEKDHNSLKKKYSKPHYDLLLNKALSHILLSEKHGYDLDVLFSCIENYDIDMFTLISLVTKNFEKNLPEDKEVDNVKNNNIKNNQKPIPKKKVDKNIDIDVEDYKNRDLDDYAKKDTSGFINSKLDFSSKGEKNNF